MQGAKNQNVLGEDMRSPRWWVTEWTLEHCLDRWGEFERLGGRRERHRGPVGASGCLPQGTMLMSVGVREGGWDTHTEHTGGN